MNMAVSGCATAMEGKAAEGDKGQTKKKEGEMRPCEKMA
jgi:hypothetical protein